MRRRLFGPTIEESIGAMSAADKRVIIGRCLENHKPVPQHRRQINTPDTCPVPGYAIGRRDRLLQPAFGESASRNLTRREIAG